MTTFTLASRKPGAVRCGLEITNTQWYGYLPASIRISRSSFVEEFHPADATLGDTMVRVGADDPRRIVIVVDDERATRESVAHLFHQAGFESRCATDGLDAMLLLRRLETRPCLVLTDVKMPVMDGNALYAAVRGDPELESVPIVFMSDDIRAVHAEAPIVEKPVSLATLLETTRKYGDR